jgi:nucleoside-diphosphate-sugar epimerase
VERSSKTNQETVKKYLVTGGTGFIGSALVRSLLESGASVRSIDNDSRGARRRLGTLADDVDLITADIRDADAVVKAAKGMDSVLHLAYVNGTEFFYTKPDLVLDVAVRGMVNVIDAVMKHNVPELVLASSSEVYQTPPTVPTDETAPLSVPDPLNPRYSYGGGKIIAELMTLNYGRTHIPRVVIFRPHNAYGPDMGWEHVIPQLALRAARLKPQASKGRIALPIQGSGTERRSFIYIDDLVSGIRTVIDKGQHLGIYHVGTGDEVTIIELAREIGRSLGVEVDVVPGQLQPGGTLRRCPDISKLRALGFAPTVSLRDGVARTAPWYAENLSQAPAPTAKS